MLHLSKPSAEDCKVQFPGKTANTDTLFAGLLAASPQPRARLADGAQVRDTSSFTGGGTGWPSRIRRRSQS